MYPFWGAFLLQTPPGPPSLSWSLPLGISTKTILIAVKKNHVKNDCLSVNTGNVPLFTPTYSIKKH